MTTEYLRQRLENAEKSLRATQDSLNRANDRISELEAQLASVQAELEQDITCPYCELLAETQAKNSLLEVAYERMQRELAAVPKWTRITKDKSTWPPDGIRVFVSDTPSECWAATLTPFDNLDFVWGLYWIRSWKQPITPPEPEP